MPYRSHERLYFENQEGPPSSFFFQTFRVRALWKISSSRRESIECGVLLRLVKRNGPSERVKKWATMTSQVLPFIIILSTILQNVIACTPSVGPWCMRRVNNRTGIFLIIKRDEGATLNRVKLDRAACRSDAWYFYFPFLSLGIKMRYRGVKNETNYRGLQSRTKWQSQRIFDYARTYRAREQKLLGVSRVLD